MNWIAAALFVFIVIIGASILFTDAATEGKSEHHIRHVYIARIGMNLFLGLILYGVIHVFIR